MESTFRRFLERPSARQAFVEVETCRAIAHQIRVIRVQRGWTQKELAERLGTTQANVSRLERPSYGKLSLGTLLKLANVFDTGLEVKFGSLIEQMKRSWVVREEDLEVPSFASEAQWVAIADTSPSPSGMMAELEFSPQQWIIQAPTVGGVRPMGRITEANNLSLGIINVS